MRNSEVDAQAAKSLSRHAVGPAQMRASTEKSVMFNEAKSRLRAISHRRLTGE